MVLLEHLNSFKAGIELLLAGFLRPELVPPIELYRALTDIEIKLQNSYVEFTWCEIAYGIQLHVCRRAVKSIEEQSTRTNCTLTLLCTVALTN